MHHKCHAFIIHCKRSHRKYAFGSTRYDVTAMIDADNYYIIDVNCLVLTKQKVEVKTLTIVGLET